MTQNQCGKPTSINRDKLGIELIPLSPLRYPTCRTIHLGEQGDNPRPKERNSVS